MSGEGKGLEGNLGPERKTIKEFEQIHKGPPVTVLYSSQALEPPGS